MYTLILCQQNKVILEMEKLITPYKHLHNKAYSKCIKSMDTYAFMNIVDTTGIFLKVQSALQLK